LDLPETRELRVWLEMLAPRETHLL